MRKNIFTASVLCLVLCFNFSTCGFPQENYENKKAADFNLEELSGEDISLSDFKGKGVILFFWFTSCPHCVRALSTLDREYPDMTASDIKLLAIDIGESKAIVERFKQKYSIKYPILLDSDTNVAYRYGVRGVPTFILISKDGRIVLASYALPDNYKELILE